MIRLRLIAIIALSIALIGLNPVSLRAEDAIEKAGVGVGITAGNMMFLPIKAATVAVSALAGALSWIVTGGNSELTQQIWRDTSEGPYAITPEVARMAVGQRPELAEKK